MIKREIIVIYKLFIFFPISGWGTWENFASQSHEGVRKPSWIHSTQLISHVISVVCSTSEACVDWIIKCEPQTELTYAPYNFIGCMGVCFCYKNQFGFPHSNQGFGCQGNRGNHQNSLNNMQFAILVCLLQDHMRIDDSLS